MQVKISIVVPVYKVESELDRCVQSLIGQTYKNIEIILVDDGSPDRCPEYCENYAKMDVRIKVIHKENGGLSDARNAGLSQATGEYVLYVDSDDYIDIDACERFINIAEKDNADIIVGNAVVEKSGENEYLMHSSIIEGKIYNTKDFLKNVICAQQWYAPAWLNMYRREYLLEHDLFYKKGIYFEDMQMLPRVFLAAKKITCINGTFYHYVIRDNSIMTSQKNDKKMNDAIENMKEWKICFDNVADKELQRYLYGMFIKCYIHECREYRITNREISGVSLSFVVKYGLNMKEKIKALIWLLCPKLYVRL